MNHHLHLLGSLCQKCLMSLQMSAFSTQHQRRLLAKQRPVCKGQNQLAPDVFTHHIVLSQHCRTCDTDAKSGSHAVTRHVHQPVHLPSDADGCCEHSCRHDRLEHAANDMHTVKLCQCSAGTCKPGHALVRKAPSSMLRSACGRPMRLLTAEMPLRTAVNMLFITLAETSAALGLSSCSLQHLKPICYVLPLNMHTHYHSSAQYNTAAAAAQPPDKLHMQYADTVVSVCSTWTETLEYGMCINVHRTF